MANFEIDKIIDTAKNLLGGDEPATAPAEESKNDLLSMASGLIGNLGSEDKNFFGVAQDVIKKLGISTTDVFEILKDGKIDMSDLLTLGKIITKIKG